MAKPSKKIRETRKRLAKRRTKKKAKKLKRKRNIRRKKKRVQQKKENVKNRVKKRAEPVTSEAKATKEEAQKLKSEVTGSGSGSDSKSGKVSRLKAASSKLAKEMGDFSEEASDGDNDASALLEEFRDVESALGEFGEVSQDVIQEERNSQSGSKKKQSQRVDRNPLDFGPNEFDFDFDDL